MTFQPRSEADLRQSLSVAIQPSACGRHLVRYEAPDAPYFYLGDTAWELFHRLDDAEAEMYLRNRAAKGFTSVMVVILAEHGGLDFPNREGHWPFAPSAESTSSSYMPDLSQPNPAYFAFIDRVVSLAASLGITITLVPTWGRYVNGGFYTKPILFTEDNAYQYGKFLGQRYPFHPFVLGGDSVRYWNPSTKELLTSGGELDESDIHDFGPVWEAMAKGLKEGEVAGAQRIGVGGYETLITYHSCQCWYLSRPEATGSAQFPDSDWLNLDCCQSGHYNGPWPRDPSRESAASAEKEPASEEGQGVGGQIGGGGPLPMGLWRGGASFVPIRKMYNTLRPDGRPRPVIDLEPHYEATHHWFTYTQKLWTADDIRSGAWQGVFAGACGYTYGCNSIWQMHNPESETHPPIEPPTTAYTPWYLELDLSGAFYSSVLRKFFLTLPNYFSRRPDSSFILSATGEDQGDDILDRLVQGLKADSWAMVHLPYGGTVNVDIDRAIQGETYRAWWVCPSTGGKASLNKGEKQTARGAQEFTSPSEGSLKDDWVLLLEIYSV